MIKCRLEKLILDKQVHEGRKITNREIAEKTGISASTISRLASNQITRFEAETLASLCAYFDCTLGDLLIYEKSK